MEEIINKVKQSSLIQLDLADFKPHEKIALLDVKDFLWKGLAIREKDFRNQLKTFDWSIYKNSIVAVFCSVDVIVPTWTYMLIISQLQQNGIEAIVGDEKVVENQLILSKINALDLKSFENGKIIIKGCAKILDPAYAMSELTKKLQTVASSIMYGEPCSTVPVYKRKKLG